MASLAQIRDQIIRRLSGGDPSSDSQFDEREIELYILQVANSAVKIEYFTNIKAEDQHGVSGQYIYTFTADVKKDTSRGEEYIEITTPYVSLPNDKGLLEVDPLNGKCKNFIPVKAGFNSLFKGTPAGNLEGQVGFYPERNKVFFSKPIICLGTSKVRVKLIVMAGADTVFDPGQENSIIQGVLEILLPQLPQDRIANNVDDNGNIAGNNR